MLPSIKNWNDSFIAMACNAKECGLGHVEVVAGRIAPPSVVVCRAEVGGSDDDRSMRNAPGAVEPGVAN